MAYRVINRTEYRYPSTVSASFGELMMLPRDLPGQRCLRSALTIEPEPGDLRERVDFFGNRATYFAVLDPHTRLSVIADCLVRVRGRRAQPSSDPIGWEQARDRVRGARGSGPGADLEALDARQFVLNSPLVTLSTQLVDYATASFKPELGLLDAVRGLASRIHRDFEYLPGATQVTSTIEDVLRCRAGVCQDFAHLAIGCLRSLGLAARYVSGYLETRPPPGKPRLVGVDVSHAWFSVFLPGTGWVDMDPTNDQLVDDHYVTTAWGRDYTDVPPVKGVIFTQGDRQDLRVSVDVIPVSEDGIVPEDAESSSDNEASVSEP